jgi:hypothetical protein
MVNASEKVRVALRRERMPAIVFQRDERAALPRKAGAGLDYVRVTPGAPEPFKSRLGQNIFVSAFPYPQWVHGTGSRAWQDYRLVEVETGRWRITVCPDLAGRILGLTDRQLGRELLWQPTAFQFAPIGLPGAWLLGGIEFNAFRFGHCVQGMMPVRTERVQLAGGFTGLRWGAVDELLECEWSVVLTPLANSVAVQVTLQNHSDRPQPGYWWTNIAVPAKQGTRFFYHPGPVLHHGCDMGMVYEQWPRLNGNDWQYWQNHGSIISAYCPEYRSDVFGYAPAGEGWAMVHHADRRICRGRKLWSVGSGHDADVWMDRVGEPSAESYCEIQSGRLPTQLEADLLPPHARLTWVEFFSTVPCPSGDDAAVAFSEFERMAIASVNLPSENSPSRPFEHFTPQPRDADFGLPRPRGGGEGRGEGAARRMEVHAESFWQVTQTELLVEQDPRLALSRKVVLSPSTVTAAEIEQATRRGWVGGRPWVRLLEQAPADEWRDLALGAARLDLNEEPGAMALLTPLARHDGECGGYASLLLGHREHERGQPEAAAKHLRQAVARLPENLHALRWLHEALLQTNRLPEIRELWHASANPGSCAAALDRQSVTSPAGLPPTIAASDVARFARAQIAFLERQWQDARIELERPMPCIAEGAAGPWLLRKEIELAEALEKYAAGRFEEAQGHLLDGCRFMPQFGVGRYETTGNVDLLFYRWLLASLAGARFQAETLASRILRFHPYPGSVEAAYVLRLAQALRDPSSGSLARTFHAPRRVRARGLQGRGRSLVGRVPSRGALLPFPSECETCGLADAVAAWDAEAEPCWRELLPLRYAVRQGTETAWQPLQHHLLYRYRAQFELTLDRKRAQQS